MLRSSLFSPRASMGERESDERFKGLPHWVQKRLISGSWYWQDEQRFMIHSHSSRDALDYRDLTKNATHGSGGKEWAEAAIRRLEMISDAEGNVVHAVGGTKSDRRGRVVIV